jgi:hypothetical protein
LNTVKDSVVETTTGIVEDNYHFLDLQDILDITEEINDDGAHTVRGRKSSSTVSYNNRNRTSTVDSKRLSANQYSLPSFENSNKNDFGDEYLFLNKDNFLNTGYLMKKKKSAVVYQRKYFILTPTMLFCFDKESDVVSNHVAAVEGKLFVKDIQRVIQDNITSPLEFSLVLDNNVTYEFQAYTDKEADTWYSQLCLVVDTNAHDVIEDSATLDYIFVDKRRQNIANYRRSSVGGIPAVVNHLKFPTKSKLPTKCGYLEKYNNIYWQKRYFKLEQPGILCWYGSEKDALSDTSMKNSLLLERILSVEQSDEDSCCFDVDIRGKTYYLKALSAGQAEEWCDCITSWSKFFFIANNKRGSALLSDAAISGHHTRERSVTSASGLTDCSVQRNNIEMGKISTVDSTTPINTVSNGHVNGRGGGGGGGGGERGSIGSLGSYVSLSPERKQGPVMIKASMFSLSKWKCCKAAVVPPGVLVITNELSTAELESINMWEVLSVDVLDSSEEEEDSENCLEINLKGKTVVVKLSTADERDGWVACLSAWAKTENLDLEVDIMVDGDVIDDDGDDNSFAATNNAEDKRKQRRRSFFDSTMDKLWQHNRLLTSGNNGNGNGNNNYQPGGDSLTLPQGSQSSESPVKIVNQTVHFGNNNNTNNTTTTTTTNNNNNNNNNNTSVVDNDNNNTSDKNTTGNDVNNKVKLPDFLEGLSVTLNPQDHSEAIVDNSDVEEKEEEEEEEEEWMRGVKLSQPSITSDDSARQHDNNFSSHSDNSIENNETAAAASASASAAAAAAAAATASHDDHDHDDADDDDDQTAMLQEPTEISPFSGLSRFFRRLSAGSQDEAGAVNTAVKQQRKSVLSDMLHMRNTTNSTKLSTRDDDDDDAMSDEESMDQVGELMPTRLKTNSIFQNNYTEDQFVAKVCERSLIRRNTQLPSAWVGGGGADRGKNRRRKSIEAAASQSDTSNGYHRYSSNAGGEREEDSSRTRTESTCADQTFIERNTNTNQDDFVNQLKTRSYHELNREFWHRHRWYLTAVVCYVTLHVLSVTSYMISETSFEQE